MSPSTTSPPVAEIRRDERRDEEETPAASPGGCPIPTTTTTTTTTKTRKSPRTNSDRLRILRDADERCSNGESIRSICRSHGIQTMSITTMAS